MQAVNGYELFALFNFVLKWTVLYDSIISLSEWANGTANSAYFRIIMEISKTFRFCEL